MTYCHSSTVIVLRDYTIRACWFIVNLCNFCNFQHIDSGISSGMRELLASGDSSSLAATFYATHISLRRHIPATLPIPQKNCNHIRSALLTDPRRLHQSRKWKRKLIRVNPPSFEISLSSSKFAQSTGLLTCFGALLASILRRDTGCPYRKFL